MKKPAGATTWQCPAGADATAGGLGDALDLFTRVASLEAELARLQEWRDDIERVTAYQQRVANDGRMRLEAELARVRALAAATARGWLARGGMAFEDMDRVTRALAAVESGEPPTAAQVEAPVSHGMPDSVPPSPASAPEEAKMEMCASCAGTGEDVNDRSTCRRCGGCGEVCPPAPSSGAVPPGEAARLVLRAVEEALQGWASDATTAACAAGDVLAVLRHRNLLRAPAPRLSKEDAMRFDDLAAAIGAEFHDGMWFMPFYVAGEPPTMMPVADWIAARQRAAEAIASSPAPRLPTEPSEDEVARVIDRAEFGPDIDESLVSPFARNIARAVLARWSLTPKETPSQTFGSGQPDPSSAVFRSANVGTRAAMRPGRFVSTWNVCRPAIAMTVNTLRITSSGSASWNRSLIEFTNTILLEEVEELWDAIKTDAAQEEVLAELRQVVAMCVRYVDTGDRYRGMHPAVPARGTPQDGGSR